MTLCAEVLRRVKQSAYCDLMTQNSAGPDWAARLAAGIAAEVKRHRKLRGMSAQQLADRCAELGLPIQRSVLANLESGRRTTVGVAELLVIASALQVPPVALVAPVGYERKMEFLPGQMMDPISVALWISGEGQIDSSGTPGEELENSALGLGRRYFGCEWDVLFARAKLSEAYDELCKLDSAELAIGRRITALDRRVKSLLKETRRLEDVGQRDRSAAVYAESRALREELRELHGKADEYESRKWELDRARSLYEQARENLLAVRKAMSEASLLIPDAPGWIDDDILERTADV